MDLTVSLTPDEVETVVAALDRDAERSQEIADDPLQGEMVAAAYADTARRCRALVRRLTDG